MSATLSELGARLRRGETTPRQLAAEARSSLEEISPLNAVLRFTEAR